LEYVTLGSTGLRVSRVSFGAGPVAAVMIGDNAVLQRKLVERVLNAGINWIDTAASYGDGRAEIALGNALDALGAGPEVQIATKVRLLDGDLDNIDAAVRRSVKASLQRLRVPQVALIQLHNAITSMRGEEPTSVTPRDVLGPTGVLKSFENLQNDGLVKARGITAIGQPGPIRDVVSSGQFDTIQVPYNLVNPTAGQDVSDDFAEANYGNIISCAADHKMGVFAIRVYAGGVLAGSQPSRHARTTKFFPVALFQRDQQRVTELRKILPPGANIKQLALRFSLGHPGVSSAIVGFSEPSHVDDALQATEPIPAEMLHDLKQFAYV
jgi:aryl-alcohol dehydrogenase-like predicted oxidoreductase